ncbi:aspartyl protease family protein 1, partial [Quercus suber]
TQAVLCSGYRAVVKKAVLVIEFNIYNPNSSSTSESVPCNSTLCVTLKCASQSTNCAYEIKYVLPFYRVLLLGYW